MKHQRIWLVLVSGGLIGGLMMNHYAWAPERKLQKANDLFRAKDWRGIEILYGAEAMRDRGWNPGEYELWMKRYIEPQLGRPVKTEFTRDQTWLGNEMSITLIAKAPNEHKLVSFRGWQTYLFASHIGPWNLNIPTGWIFEPPLKRNILRAGSLRLLRLEQRKDPGATVLAEYEHLLAESEWLGQTDLAPAHSLTKGVPMRTGDLLSLLRKSRVVETWRFDALDTKYRNSAKK